MAVQTYVTYVLILIHLSVSQTWTHLIIIPKCFLFAHFGKDAAHTLRTRLPAGLLNRRRKPLSSLQRFPGEGAEALDTSRLEIAQ